ncbi:tRNA (adenosine(37)-N6)-threonylcarbamoyltransferase complex transferase subunit TsaD [Candidatus Woesearchaeota archaeon]|nr:tRNA (adenosine(37)-N6)-threonylcarbamoyltransferase complex transferase subunit TsaD [Candidatus Woesearchaeota archaeon]
MIVLGIESTAHTFGAAIFKEERVLANVKTAFSTKTGGMVPARVADHHIEICDEIVRQACDDARVSPKDIGLVAYSRSPGLGHTLRVGATLARSLALLLKKPLVGVNHCIAHLEIGRLMTPAEDPVMLYASGANTQVVAYEAGRYRIFGETLDIGVGNFLDGFGRALGLGFPAGPAIERLAKKGAAQNVALLELPYSVKGMDVSFGGMLTKLKTMIRSKKYSKEQLCFSVQEIVFAMLVEVTERAMAHCDKKEVVLGGGVACNKRLQEMCSSMCKERKAKSHAPRNEFLVDNAAMIAWTGLRVYHQSGAVKPEQAGIDPYERTDDVEVNHY